MEEADKTKKFRFPGYDGALPKAMRSSRGRKMFQKRLNQAPEDLQCIELLATVAGQVSQAAIVQGGHDVTQNLTGMGTEMEDGDIGSLYAAGLPAVRVVCACEHHQSPKTTSGMIGKDAGKVMYQDFLKGFSLQNVENVLCASARQAKGGSCQEEGNGFEDNSHVKEDCSNHAIGLELPEPGYSESHVHSEGHGESDANCSAFRDRDAREEGSCMTLLRDSSPPASSDSSEEAPTHVHKQSRDQCRKQSLEGHLDCSQDLVRLKARDDDDNFSNSVVPVATSQWGPSMFKSLEGPQIPYSSGEEVSVALTKRKGIFTDGADKTDNKQSTQREKRSHISGFLKGRVDLENSSSPAPLDLDAKDASVASSPTTTSKGSWKSAKRKAKEAHESSPVRVNITSFRVPELSINLPETATIASLKRAVMEAAVNLLGGGLHVRVLHHNKKVYDENSTLLQMGVSCKERLESLAFMLEPNGMSNTSMNSGEPVIAYPKARSQPSTWIPFFALSDDMDGSKKTVDVSPDVHAETDMFKKSEKQRKYDMIDKVGGELDVPCELSQPTGAALILRHGTGDNASADIATAQQGMGGLGGKRRTRRPFTVMEVDALVQAVELLGTGRWREVKQQVFSHARHRTYVDLKDKWKTLVHTARIAPQQRRGEPVPQELLDRVLQAHTYWAVQLAKQQEDLSI